MAFTPQPSSDLDVGDPTKKDIFDLTRTNEIDLDSRLTTQEQGAGKIEAYNFILGNASSATTLTGIAYYTSPSAFTLIDAKVGIFEVGSLTGTLEMDIQKNTSRDDVGMTSVFTTKPSVDLGTASDFDNSSNAVFDGAQTSVAIGDVLRLDLTSLPSPVIGKIAILLIGEL